MSAINTLGVTAAMREAAGKGGVYESQQAVSMMPVPLFHVTGEN